jgi:probable rRNA maturation factor
VNISIDIAAEADEWDSIEGLEVFVRRAAAIAIESAGTSGGEVSIVLSDDDHIRELNKHHRGIDKATNVLSFPAAPVNAPGAPRLLGDIVLAYETVAREAKDESKPFLNHAAHLVVHGVLHLLGFDHENDGDAEKMEAKERSILSALGIPDPYEGTEARLA